MAKKDKSKAEAETTTPELQEAPPVEERLPPKTPNRVLTPAQKAAAVIVSLGAEKASLVYQFMESAEVEKITLEVAQLGFLDSLQTEDVLSEYYQMCLTNKAVTEGGIEYARAVLEKAFGESTADTLLNKITKTLKNRSFQFLDKADPKTLFAILQHERPQTIALILSYVESNKAARLVAQLDPRTQIKVVENMARMEGTSPDAIKAVEEEMAKKFSNMTLNADIKVGGIDYVAQMMNSLDRADEINIFDGLSVYDAELVEEIRKRMFIFEDIAFMDDRSIQKFVRDCDPRDIVLSLKNAPNDVASKILSNMSSRMAQNIRDDLEITTNVRKKDIDEAQQRIVGIIRDLEDKGELIILKSGKDDIIA